MNKSIIKMSKNDKVFDVFNMLFLIFIFLLVSYPIVFIVSNSISDAKFVTSGKVWLFPRGINFKAYTSVVTDKSVLLGYANSFFYASVGTLFNVVFTLIAAYPLSRKDLRGRKPIMFLFTFTMMFSGGLIPTYQVVQGLHLIDTRWALILPSLIGVWNLVVARTFFQASIPFELYESAEIDGASDIRTFVSIVLPVSKPIIAVISLYYAVNHWNAFFDAMIYLKSSELFPLQIPLRNILIVNSMDMSLIDDTAELIEKQAMMTLLKYSLIVVASLPVMVLYPFVQKHFVTGIMIGSVKG